MYLSQELVTAVKRKRGERNITVQDLAIEMGVSRWTIDRLFSGATDKIRPTTNAKLVDWLAKNS